MQVQINPHFKNSIYETFFNLQKDRWPLRIDRLKK